MLFDDLLSTPMKVIGAIPQSLSLSSVPQFLAQSHHQHQEQEQEQHQNRPKTQVMDIIPPSLARSASPSQSNHPLLSLQPDHASKDRVLSMILSPSSSSLPSAADDAYMSNVAGLTAHSANSNANADTTTSESRRNSIDQAPGDRHAQARELIAKHHHNHNHRSKTHFRLALPPPRGRQHIRLRRKLLLQIQQVMPSHSAAPSSLATTATTTTSFPHHPSRPVPTLDVLPASTLLHPHHRLSKRQRLGGSLHGKKRAFGSSSPADVIVVPSDKYDTGTVTGISSGISIGSGSSIAVGGSGGGGGGSRGTPLRVSQEIDEGKISMSSDDDNNNNHNNNHWIRLCDDKDVRAAIFQPRALGEPGEIVLGKNVRWEVLRMSSGSYEFVRTHQDGSKSVARWVLRSKKHGAAAVAASAGSRRSSGYSSAQEVLHDGPASSSSAALKNKKKKFTFSIIDPTTRRHPVIAWLSRTGFEILDQYSPVPASASASAGQGGVGSRPTSNQQYDREEHSPVVSPRSSIINSNEEPPVYGTDDALRFFISVTAIYIALREDWTRADNILGTEHYSSRESSPGPGFGLYAKPGQRKISQGTATSSVFPGSEAEAPSHSRPSTPQNNRDSLCSLPPLAGQDSGSALTQDEFGGEEETDNRARNAIPIEPYPAPQPPQQAPTGEAVADKGKKEEPEKTARAGITSILHNHGSIKRGSSRLQSPQRPLEVRILEPPGAHSRHHHQDELQQQGEGHTGFRRPPPLTLSSFSSMSSAGSAMESNFAAGNRNQQDHNRLSHGTRDAQVQHPREPSHNHSRDHNYDQDRHHDRDHHHSSKFEFGRHSFSALRNSIRRPKKKHDSLASTLEFPSSVSYRDFGANPRQHNHKWHERRSLSSWLGIDSLKRKMKHSGR